MSAPKVNSQGEKELAKAEAQFEEFNTQVKTLSSETMSPAPVRESESQTQLSTREINKQDGFYLKPKRTISCREKFNETYRSDYEKKKEYVRFIAENLEIIGETIPIWTRPYPGLSAEEWEVPVNKVVVGPRYLAEQISRKSYTRLKMENSATTGSDGLGTYYGQLVASHKVQRLDARPAAGFNKNVSMF